MALPKEDWYKNWYRRRPESWKEMVLYLRDTSELTNETIDRINKLKKEESLDLELAIATVLKELRNSKRAKVKQIDVELRALGIDV